MSESPIYDREKHAWVPRCPHGDVCSGCDALGFCTREEGGDGSPSPDRKCDCHLHANQVCDVCQGIAHDRREQLEDALRQVLAWPLPQGTVETWALPG